MVDIPTPEEGLRQRLDDQLEALRIEQGDNFSRYAITRLHPILEKRQVRFGIWNSPKISLVNPFYRVVRAEDIGRLDNISAEYYDDPRFWWAIGHVNLIRNQFVDMEIGMTLVIPRRDAILESLASGDSATFEV